MATVNAKVKQQQNMEMLQTAKYIKDKFRRLMTVGSGTLLDIDAFNKVFKDVFGIKKFGTKIRRASGPLQFLELMNELGAKTAFTICDNQQDFMLFASAIKLEAKIEKLEAKIRRAQKKDLPPKEKWVERLEKYQKLYKKTVKSMHKYYGVTGDVEFGVLKDFIKAGKGGYGLDEDWSSWDGSWEAFGDSWGDDLWRKGDKSSPFGMNPIMGPIDDDDDDIDFDDDDDEDDDFLDNIDDRLTRIESAIVTLANRESGATTPKKAPKKQRVVVNQEATNVDPSTSNILKSLAQLGDVVQTIADGQIKLIKRIDDIEDDLYSDEDYEEEGADTPEDVARNNAEIMAQMLGE